MVTAYVNKLHDAPLFCGITTQELEELIDQMNPEVCFFEQGQVIFEAGSEIHSIGIVLSGSISVSRLDINDSIFASTSFDDGEMFGEVFAALGILGGFTTISSKEYTAIAFFDYSSLITPSSCSGHPQVIRNFFSQNARKMLLQERRTDILSNQTLRGKLHSFFEYQREMTDSDTFIIPYNREELSDYLCVDRSALSRELSKMSNDHIIEFRKSRFTMLKS